MADKSDIKAELERKKQRLAQIREEKKRKEEERKKKETETQQKAEAAPVDSDLDRKRRETEALLQSIGISPEPPLVPNPMSPSKSVSRHSTPSETGSQDSADGAAAGRYRSGLSGVSKHQAQAQSDRTLQWDTDPSVLQLQDDSELGRRMHRLGASKITQVDFLPREVVSYCKETQTPITGTTHLSDELVYSTHGVHIGCCEIGCFFFSPTPSFISPSVLQSPVVSVGFARFHPNLVVGGTYSGQIVLWDNRSHRRTPVQRTPLSAAAHTHPVYCVNVVGTQNANNLITVSTDGRMCSWSLDMLSQPQESMELVYNKSKAVAVTGMAFPTGDVNNYVVGSEEGTVYTASRHGSKAGICEMFEGHQGPVTGLSCHNAVGPVDFSHLFVTSSFDWTVKLWSTKHNKPLYSFEDNADYVYDVMWSPVHPALFAAVDGMGRLDLWNLNNDTEVPTASVTIEGASALNRVRWGSGGKEVAVGDSEGRLWIYDAGELAVPHSEDWARFAHTLMEIKANRADGEEEGPVELTP
ncbi:cytoplasmic dynein 1 intermediate chain 1 [Salmo trutta]|nr:cytoplasmic dynein 1 intermediate chain 1-like [Salmo trutta]